MILEQYSWFLQAACTVVLLIAAGIVLLFARRAKSKKKVRQMEMPEKIALLNKLAEPFGFFYDEKENVFSSRRDARQRKEGRKYTNSVTCTGG